MLDDLVFIKGRKKTMEKRYSIFFVIAIVVMMCVTFSATGQAQPAADTKDPDYYRLVKQLKNNDMSIDFQVLRLAYTRTPDYKPYGADSNDKDAAFKALGKKDFPEALRLAQSALETNYVDLDMHLLCKIAYREMRNSERDAFHTSVLKGLVNSIYTSGDGSTPEKAMTVISVPEEYFILNANGLKMIKTKTLTVNGHDYDGMDVENKKTGEKKTVYFNIDLPRQYLTKQLKQK